MKKLIIKGMGKRYFSDKIVKWYLENRRPLPWRETTDPYHIWLSEVILQQTRVAQGLPYYHNFLLTFPTIRHLADASEQNVLRLWQGLGYYTRARNLHKCAKTVTRVYAGKFPDNFEELKELPGIGHYTAAAIASFAFNEQKAVVDGNVFRILSRIFGIDTPINTPEGRKKFQALADELICEKQPGLHNQAVMEFGATFCTPQNPKCGSCPFFDSCYARKHESTKLLPVKIPPRKPRTRYFYYLVLQKGKSVLMKKREGKDIWQGLYEFALVEKSRPIRPESLLQEKEWAAYLKHADVVSVSKTYIHILTHQKIRSRFLHAKLNKDKNGDSASRFYTMKELTNLPKPVLITRFLSNCRDLGPKKIGTFDPV